MKLAATIARYLLGLIFFVFGLNHFLNFIPSGPMPTGFAGQFMGSLIGSHYMLAVAFFEVVCGLLLLVNRYVPLALTLLAPIIVNILITGLLLTFMALPMAVILVFLWLLVANRLRSSFSGILEPRGQQ